MKANIVKLGGYAMVAKSIIDRLNHLRTSHQRAIRRTRAANLALGASLGTAVGVAAGVLFAPKSGKETREEISRRTGDAYHSLRSNVSDARGRVTATIKDKSARLRNAAETCAEAVGEAVVESSESDDSKSKKKSAKK